MTLRIFYNHRLNNWKQSFSYSILKLYLRLNSHYIASSKQKSIWKLKIDQFDVTQKYLNSYSAVSSLIAYMCIIHSSFFQTKFNLRANTLKQKLEIQIRMSLCQTCVHTQCLSKIIRASAPYKYSLYINKIIFFKWNYIIKVCLLI